MKLFIFLPLLIGFSSAAPQHLEDGVYMFEGLINSTIQALLATLPESFDLPLSLDISTSEGTFNGTLKVENLTLSGVKEMKVPALKLNPLGVKQLNITVEFDSLSIKGDHYEDLVLMDLLPVYGEGPANIELGLTIKLGTKLNMTSDFHLLNLLDFWIQIGMTSARCDIEGLYYDDSFSEGVNTFLDGYIPNLINSAQELITSKLSPVIEDLINGLLAGDSALKEALMQAELLAKKEIKNT